MGTCGLPDQRVPDATRPSSRSRSRGIEAQPVHESATLHKFVKLVEGGVVRARLRRRAAGEAQRGRARRARGRAKSARAAPRGASRSCEHGEQRGERPVDPREARAYPPDRTCDIRETRDARALGGLGWGCGSTLSLFPFPFQYDVVDEDDPTRVISLPSARVLRLTAPVEDGELHKGDQVLAVFPETTSFYRAVISKAPRRCAGGAIECIVKFEDDEDESGRTPHRRVHSRFVLPMPRPSCPRRTTTAAAACPAARPTRHDRARSASSRSASARSRRSAPSSRMTSPTSSTGSSSPTCARRPSGSRPCARSSSPTAASARRPTIRTCSRSSRARPEREPRRRGGRDERARACIRVRAQSKENGPQALARAHGTRPGGPARTAESRPVAYRP